MRANIGKYLQFITTRVLSHSVVFCVSLFFTAATLANPVLDNVAAGNATVDQTATTTTINQTSDRAILNWQSFNIGGNESTHFNQPTNGVALNRINAAQGASQIYGALTATGQIILINPAGIYFAPGSFVNVGGLIATTANISNQDFLNGYYHFNQASPFANASITNAGQIVAANNGLIALVGGNVTNTGLIQANLGHVVLASGNTFVVNFDGSNLIHFALTSAGSKVTNTGSLIANGGHILISAKAASGVIDHVINVEGSVEANAVYEENGDIVIAGDPDAGVVRIAADIDADNGDVSITGHNILLDAGTRIDVSGDIGAGNIFVGGNDKGQGALPNANALVMAPDTTLLANAITSGNGGHIILWSDNVTKAYGRIEAKGGALAGNGGFVETSSKHYLDVAGISVDTSAPFGLLGTWLLDPYDVTISTDVTLDPPGFTNLFEASGTNSNVHVADLVNNLYSNNVTITTGSSGTEAGDIDVLTPIFWASSSTLELSANRNINIFDPITNPTNGNLILRADNTGSGVGTVTFAGSGSVHLTGVVDLFYNPSSYTSPTNFSPRVNSIGVFNPYMLVNNAANVNSIRNNVSASGVYALSKNIDIASLGAFTPIPTFSGQLNGQNFNITNLLVTAAGPTGFFSALTNAIISNLNLSGTVAATGSNIGMLAGNATNSIIDNVRTSGAVSSSSFTGSLLGGLVGTISGTTSISHSGSTATVTGSTLGGGLVGSADANTNISFSYATGDVTVTGFNGNAGGFIGVGSGTITDSYSTGDVTDDGGGSVGGFAGSSNGSIARSYSTGNTTLSAGGSAGGFVGTNGGDITDSYSTGASGGGGFIGYMTGGTVQNAYATGYSLVSGFFNYGFGGAVLNSYWNTDTTGQDMGFQFQDGEGGFTTVTNLFGGCLSGICALQPNAIHTSNPGDAVNLSLASTFDTFDFTPNTGVWSNIEGYSYPFLQVNYPNVGPPPRIIEGTAQGAVGGDNIRLLTDGVLHDSVKAGADGSFYYVAGLNQVSGIDKTIPDNHIYLVYLDNNNLAINANVIAKTLDNGASSSNEAGVDIIATNTIIFSNTGENALTNNEIITLLGSYSDADIIFTAPGGILTPNANVGITTTANSTYDLSGGFNLTNASATFNGPVTLTGASSLTTTTGGNIIFNNTINGAQDLIINSSGTVLLGGLIGGTTPLNSISVTSTGAFNLNGGGVSTVNTQTWNSPITLGAPTTFTLTGTGAQSINIGGAITAGGNNVNLTGTNPAGNYSFNITAPLTGVNALSVTGAAAGNNTFTFTSGGAQTYHVTGANGGAFTGTGITSGTFGNIGNITTGASNDTFMLAGGSLSGTVDGGGGVNSLTANNVANTFNITGANAGNGTSIAGFANMQNLTGGNVSNNFIFGAGSSLSGTLDGGTLNLGDPARNTINVMAFGGDVANLVGGIFGGSMTTSGGAINFNNINQLIGNPSTTNIINLPSGKTVSVDFTGFRTGSIGDPLFFTNWLVNGYTTPAPAGLNTALRTPSIIQRGYVIGADSAFQALLDALLINDNYNPAYDGKEIFIYPYCRSFSPI